MPKDVDCNSCKDQPGGCPACDGLRDEAGEIAFLLGIHSRNPPRVDGQVIDLAQARKRMHAVRPML